MKKSRHTMLWGLFAIYCVMMIYLMFWQRVGGSSYITYWEVLRTNLNLVPFRTIQEFMAVMGRGIESNHEALVRIAIVNLLGNVLMFVPLGLFLPHLWPRLHTFRCFLMSVAAVILIVELVQLFSLLGSFDIDDLILNVLGAAIGFWIYKLISAMSSKRQRKIFD